MVRFSNFTPGYISYGNEISISKRYLDTHIHGINIQNSKDMETAKSPLMNEQLKKMKHVYAMVYYLFTLRKENPEICHNIDETRGCTK